MEKEGNLRILFLEENQSEIKLYESILLDSKVEFEFKIAKTENDFIKYVNRFKPDVILSGTNLSKYSVHEALAFLKEQQLFIPFVLITGSIPDVLAKDYLKYGVDEYLTKYNLLSLPAVITKSIGIKKTEKEKSITEELNKEQEAKLQTFFDNNPESIIEIGFSNEILNMNNSAKELFNISDAKIQSKKIKFTDYIDLSKLKEFKELHANVSRGNKRSILLKIKETKSKSIWLDCKLLPLFDPEHNVASILIIGIDVTEKEFVKSDLISTKNNYQNLLASLNEALWQVDREFNIVDFNEVALKMIYSIRKKYLKVGMPLSEMAINEKRVKVWAERYERALGGESFSVDDIFEFDGQKLFALIKLYPVYNNGEIIGVSVLGRNQTLTKLAVIELEKSEKIFRTLAESALVGIIKIDKTGNCIFSNDYFSKLICAPFEEIKNKGWYICR